MKVRSEDVESSKISTAVLDSGVVIEVDRDQISFAHNILFDHAVGQFLFGNGVILIFSWGKIQATSKSGLFLGPSLRYMLEMAWTEEP